VLNSIWYTATGRRRADRCEAHWRKKAAKLRSLALRLALRDRQAAVRRRFVEPEVLSISPLALWSMMRSRSFCAAFLSKESEPLQTRCNDPEESSGSNAELRNSFK